VKIHSNEIYQFQEAHVNFTEITKFQKITQTESK